MTLREPCPLSYVLSHDRFDFGIFQLQVRVYAPPDRVNYTEFALEVANVSVDLYTDLFAIPYPLPKLGKYL